VLEVSSSLLCSLKVAIVINNVLRVDVPTPTVAIVQIADARAVLTPMPSPILVQTTPSRPTWIQIPQVVDPTSQKISTPVVAPVMEWTVLQGVLGKKPQLVNKSLYAVIEKTMSMIQ